MSNIKQFCCKELIGENYAIIEKYTKENIQRYEEKVDKIMETMQNEDVQNKF